MLYLSISTYLSIYADFQVDGYYENLDFQHYHPTSFTLVFSYNYNSVEMIHRSECTHHYTFCCWNSMCTSCGINKETSISSPPKRYPYIGNYEQNANLVVSLFRLVITCFSLPGQILSSKVWLEVCTYTTYSLSTTLIPGDA